MTSLAQMILDSPKWSQRQTADFHWELAEKEAEFGSYMFDVIRNALTNDDVPILDASFMKKKATRFIFTEDAPTVTLEAIKAGMVDRSIPIKTARLPTSTCWIEWRIKDALAGDENGESVVISGVSYIGVLLVQDWDIGMARFSDDGFILDRKKRPGAAVQLSNKKSGVIALIVVKPEGSRPFPSMGVWIPPMPFDDPNEARCSVFWSLNGPDDVLTTATLKDMFYALFLINTPRVCEIREVTHHPKIQVRRKKEGKPPLVEYKQMVLRIGIGSPRYRSSGAVAAGSTLHGAKRKLHSVIGHFRTRELPNKDQSVVSWVDEHYRGDPRLGVIIKDRHVQR